MALHFFNSLSNSLCCGDGLECDIRDGIVRKYTKRPLLALPFMSTIRALERSSHPFVFHLTTFWRSLSGETRMAKCLACLKCSLSCCF